jgi:CRP-like cAMP-binding protein
MKIDCEWLEESVFLCKLNSEECALLESLFEVLEFPADELMVRQGEAGGQLYLIRSGSARISYHSDEESVEVSTIGEGSLFGEISFLTGDPVGATVRASERCVVYSLSRSAYSELMVKNQDLVYSLFAHMLVYAGSVIRRMNVEQSALKKKLNSLL